MGKIKIFSKAVMLGKTAKLCAVSVISLVIVLLSNNLFVAVKYLFDYLSQSDSFSFTAGSFKDIGLALFYSVCILLSVLAVSPLKMSREIWFYETSKRTKMKIGRLFYFYRPKWFFKSVWLSFCLFIVKFLWAIVFFFPCAAMSGYLVYSLQGGISKTMLLLVSASVGVSFLSGLFFSFLTFQRYRLCFILFYENEGISPFEAMKYSARLMDESCFRLARLKISFLPWILSCIFVLPVFYVYPYYKISEYFFLNNILSGN
ncbi:MAG: DUF975 family protein [Clostridia bacterium]|nr:DUF975 family protein [Clostridia bacterium]